MPTLDDARAKVRELSRKGLDITSSKSLTDAQKLAQLDPIETQLKHWLGEVDALEYVATKRATLGVGSWGDRDPQPGTAVRMKAPSLYISDDQLHDMFEAAKGRKSFRAELKDNTADNTAIGLLPNVLIPGVVERRHEVRLLERFPVSPMQGPVVEFVRHASTTGAAGTVAPGALKPEVVFTPDLVTATARKIAAYATTEDELLRDFETWAGYVRNELTRVVIDKENSQLLTGTGIAPDLPGLLNTTGLLARDYTTDHTADTTVTGIDTIERAITDLRTGNALVDAADIVMHPTTWSRMRRTKDSQGRYLVNPDPTAVEAQALFGVPVFTTTTIAAGTAVVANLAAAGSVFVRDPLTLTSSNSNNDDYQRNRTSWIAEERIALAIARPSAVVQVTNLP